MVIILNGVGSVGKTSTAKALQAMAARPFLHVAMDGFLDMLPERLIGHADGLVFEAGVDDASGEGAPSVAIRSGAVLKRAMQGMRHAVAAMARVGNDLVVDEVMIGGEALAEYRSLLEGITLRVVGMHAVLAVLEARERARGDRELGLARWQFTRVHREINYDLEIDTEAMTAEAAARAICGAFGLDIGRG